jgi:hypothetical protein
MNGEKKDVPLTSTLPYSAVSEPSQTTAELQLSPSYPATLPAKPPEQS